MTFDEATQLHSAVDEPEAADAPRVTLTADEVEGRALAAIRRLNAAGQRVTRTDAHGLYEICADERRREIANELDGISRADVRRAVKTLVERGAVAVAEDGSLSLRLSRPLPLPSPCQHPAAARQRQETSIEITRRCRRFKSAAAAESLLRWRGAKKS